MIVNYMGDPNQTRCTRPVQVPTETALPQRTQQSEKCDKKVYELQKQFEVHWRSCFPIG